jgi:hypothetical protein
MKDKPFVGVWLTHREALLFWADEKANVEIQRLESEYPEEKGEVFLRPARKTGVYGSAVTNGSLERHRHEHLRHYYKKLDDILRPAKQIFLFGPGQAKRELANVLDGDKNFRARIRGIENADKKMTEAQMAALVRGFFKLPNTPL